VCYNALTEDNTTKYGVKEVLFHETLSFYPEISMLKKLKFPMSLVRKYAFIVIPDLIRNPVILWIPAFAGMTN
jgi:hypothetical protein